MVVTWWFHIHDESKLEAGVLAEATLVAQEGVELLIVDVAAVAALVRVVAAVLADAMLVGDRARAARALQLLRGHALLVEARVPAKRGRCHVSTGW